MDHLLISMRRSSPMIVIDGEYEIIFIELSTEQVTIL